MRVVVTGGGSGGHIFPALALASAFAEIDPSGEILYIGGSSGMECDIVPKSNVPFQAITARKVRKLLSPSTLGAAAALVRGYVEARQYLRVFRADAVIGAGGYVAAAATLAGVRLGLKTAILAPDLVPGRTNLMLSRYVQRVCVVFEESRHRFPTGKTQVTGLPLRAGIVAPEELSRSQARLQFDGLRPDVFTLLVIGGSQGARAINQLITTAAPNLVTQGIQVIHQVGALNLVEVRRILDQAGVGPGYSVFGFLDPDQVASAYRAADVLVCRGGISTLSEAMANGLPVAVIPLPSAYADHQTANARALREARAGYMWPQMDLTGDAITQSLMELKSNPDRLLELSEASRKMGRPDAAQAVARLILS